MVNDILLLSLMSTVFVFVASFAIIVVTMLVMAAVGFLVECAPLRRLLVVFVIVFLTFVVIFTIGSIAG